MKTPSESLDDPPAKHPSFAEVRATAAPKTSYSWKPHIDIGETASAYEIMAEMPGVRSEHLNLIYDHGYLTIEAQAPAKGYHAWHNAILNEREKGRCLRVFALPADVDIDRRREKLHQGLLTIHLPKNPGAVVKVESGVRQTTAQRDLGNA